MKNKIFMKTVSIVVAVFLLITTLINDFAYATSVTSSLQPVVTNADSFKNYSINNNVISYNSGKITSAINCNSDTVIVNIQDFHCNPSVQKNISDILSVLIEKYNIKSVYVEGGYGNINTKWLSDIKDENIKTELIKTLLENGSLTGAEYFSATNPSANINIYGIEKESVYKENFERLQNIFSNRSRYERIIKAFEKDLTFLQHKYFNTKNKKFNDLIGKYKKGNIEARKYYKILFQYVQKYKNPSHEIYGTLLPIKIEDYPNIYTYMMLGEYEKNIKSVKITAELKRILIALKTYLSYEQYSQIVKNTDNFKDMPELVSVLNKLPEDFKNANFSSEIKNFINYVEISKQINPVQLVEEERLLVENIRLALSQNEAEFDISFISDFFNYFIDYLNTSITASNYKYFSSKFDKFKILWDKYTYYNQLNNYKKDFDILDAYYKTNVQRDYLFLENIKQKDILTSGTDGKKDSNYANILESAKNIIIVVTGGFHTEGLKKVITQNNVSYMVITPNVKGNIDFANSRYAKLLQIPLDNMESQAFQLPLLSKGERVQIVYEGLKQLDIEPTQENIEMLNKTANEIISNLTGRKTRYNNLFETDKKTININENKFSEIRNVIKNAIKNNIQFVNPKNYPDETFSFMKIFLSESNGEIWEISQLPPDIVEQLRNIGYSAYLPEFLQRAYYNIGKKIKPGKEYEVFANNSPFMIKFPNGKKVVILREIDGTKYHIIDENFNWDIENKQQRRDTNPEETLVKKIEEQDYAKDNNGNSVVWLAEKQDNKIFIAANSDVEFINLNDKNLQENYCSEKQIDKDLEVIVNELNNGSNQYIQRTNMINVLEIEDFSKLTDEQVVFISLQDYSNAENSKQKHIEIYLEHAIKNNKPIIIYPDLYVNDNDLSNADLNYLFGQLGEKFVVFADDYIVKLSQYMADLPNVNNVNYDEKTKVLAYSVKELLKNAFVYGTLSNVNKPIVINFDNTNSQLDILTVNESKEENIYRKILTFSNKLRGYGVGIENIKEGVNKFNWQYLDNFKDKNRTLSCASLKLNNKNSYLQIDKSKLKNNDYYNEVSNRILEIFKKNNIDINIDKNSRTFNFIVSLLLNNENITDKDLEKLNGTKAEITELILEALNKKLISLDQTDRYYRTVLRRIEDITFVLEIKETKEIDGKEIEQTNFVSLQVLSLYGQPELFVTTKNEDRYGEGENDPVIELEFYLQDNKNYEIKNIHILDERNIIEKTFDNLLDFNKNEELKKNTDKKTIETIGYTEADLEIISLNDFVKYKTSNNPKQLTQNVIKNLEEGKIIALFPPLNNLDLQKINSFEELKYMYDVIRTILWDFSEDFKKTNNAVKSGNIDVILNEILKNAFVHGNNLKTTLPVYIYLKDGRLCISNVVDEKNFSTAEQKSAATMAGLCGVHSGIKNLQIYQGLDYKDETNNSIFTASFITTLKLNNKETKKNNIIKYKGNSFIFKKSEEELFFVVYINGQWFIQVTNNKIDKTQSNRFFPFAYGLDIKKRKDYTTIRKTREMTDYKSIIPVTDFSSIQFINITFGELSKKYFKEEKQNINIKNNTDENIFLEDFMRNDQNKIMDIWSKIDKNIKEGKTITIYPLRAYNNTNVINELVEQDYDKFIQLYTMLNSVIIKFCDNYCNKFFDDKKFDNFEEEKKKALKKELRYALIEMIKNAIVHGNHLDLSKPVTLEFDKESLNISNEYSPEKTNRILQHLAAIACLSGFGEGIENMSNKDNFFKYTDNFKEKNRTVSCASLNLYGKETFTGKYDNIQDTVFMIELPNTEEYVAKYVYVEKINGELAVTVVDNKDKLKDKNNQIIYLKKHLEKYGIENFKENNGYFEIKFKAGVKIFNLAEKNLKFEETLRDKQNQIQFADAVKQKRTFFDSLGIDTSKEIINISNENLKQIKNIEDKIIVFSLQNFNENDNENKLIDDNIKYCLQNNISVIIYPCLNKNIVNMDYADLRKLFLTTEKKLSKFSYFYGEAIAKNWKAHQNFEKYIRLSFWEILKNAVVHGNNADLILPIVVKPTKDKVEVINDNTQNKKTANDENFNLLQKFFAVIGKLHGRGLGIGAMTNIEEMLIYSDNNIRKPQNDDLWIASIEKNKKFGDFYFEQDIKDEIKAEMKTKIDIEDDMVDFFMEDIISVSDEELLKTLKGNKSEILKMLLEELDKTVFKLSAQSDIKTKIDKIQFVIETTDGNCVSFGNNGIVADNANYFSFAEPLEEDTVKNLIAKVKNIHVVFRDRQEYENYKEQFERNVKNSNNDEFKKRLYKNYPTVETIKKIGFDDGSFTALRLDEFIKDKEQFKQNLIKDLQNGKLVALFPFANTEISADANISSNLYIREDFFREISVFLVEQTIGKKYKEQAYIKYFADDVLEIFKNVFVHGNNISLDKPIYLYIKDDRLYISNVVDKENSASNYQKTLAVLSGLTGAHLGSKQIKNNIELEYQNSDIDKLKTGDIFENSIKVGDVSNVVYNGPAATSFVVSVPSKQPAFARYHVGSFNVTNYVLEVEGDRVNKSVSKEDFIFSKYGLKLETALDGKTITVIKDKNYKQGTEIIPISNAHPVLQLNGQISSKQLKKQNKKNKQFFKDLGIDISDENKYEIIHLAEDSTNSEYQIRTAVRNNKPLIIYPYLYPDFTEALKNKDYETLYFLLKDLGIKTVNFTSSYANILTKDVIDTFNLNLKKSVREVLKNAIVHGNLTDLTLPIVIKFDEQNFKIDVFNQNIQTKQEDKILKNITAAVDWTGEGDGIKDMQSYTTLEYSDNNNNNDTRKPTDKIWQTTIQKKINYKKEIRNKMHKIDIEDDTIELLLENIISIPDNELLKILDKNKSEILKMLFEEFEKTKTVDTFDPYDENTLIAEMFYIVAEKNDDTCMVLKLINNKLAIIAANADDMSENYIYIDDNMKNNLIKNIKNIHVVFTNEEETKSYAEEFEHKLKQYNSDVINRLLQKNYPSIETINKMGFTEEDLINLRLDEFIKDKDTFQKNLFDNLQNGKLVALFPFAIPETSAEDSIFLNRYVNDEFFKEISYYLAQQIRENSDTYFSVDYLKAILEILKNSFVHGNNISMNKPIFFYIKNGRLYITNVVDKENTASNYKKNLAVLANLTGVHYGNEYVKSHFYLEYKSSDFKELKNGDIYEASIKVGNINSIENQKMAGIKDSNIPKVYELLSKGIPSPLVNVYIVLKETLEIFFTSNSFVNAHEKDRQQGAKTLVKQATILKKIAAALSLSLISVSVITGTLPLLIAIQIIAGAVISMFAISAVTHYYINYEFINDVKDVINKNKENTKDGILTVKIINENIDKDININNIKLVNSGLKINGKIVWINKRNKEFVIYCKEQSYEEILPVAKNIVLKTTKANKVTEFCVDIRETAPEITEKDGITTINSSVYNELKENEISDTEIAAAIKEANSMEQKANTLYSVSKNNQIFLEYEIKDDISYNNFINKVLSENLGFGYVIDIETVNKYGKDFETKIEQAKKEKNINIYIKGKDKQINFKRIENFNDIKTLEEQIEKVNFSENIPLIPASKLFSLVDKERFTDKLIVLNKLANLLFIKREYNTDYVKDLANNADEKLLKEILSYGVETILNNLHENNIENISNLLLQNPTIKIIFKKIEKNNPQKAKELKEDFIKTLTIRTLLYNLAGEQHLRNEFNGKLNYIEELFIDILKDKKQFERLKIKDNVLTFDYAGIEFIEKLQKEYGTKHSKIFEETRYNAVTKLEYILTYLIDERYELNNDDNDFNSTLKMKALLSAA